MKYGTNSYVSPHQFYTYKLSIVMHMKSQSCQ